MSNELFERFCEEDGSISLGAALRKALLYETKLATKTCTMEESWTRSDGMVNFVNKTQHTQVAKGKKRQPCSRCGWRNHSSQECKYKNSTCHKCGKIRHLATVCKATKDRNVNFVSVPNHLNSIIIVF